MSVELDVLRAMIVHELREGLCEELCRARDARSCACTCAADEIERLRAIVKAQRLAIAAAARTLAAVDNDWPPR